MLSFPPLGQASEADLLAEWNYWNSKIESATSWGAAVAAAHEFRKDVERELHKRGLDTPQAGAI